MLRVGINLRSSSRNPDLETYIVARMSMPDFFNDFAPVIPHKSQVMSAYPCLHVHTCISACPCFLSCRFACPCLIFLTILLLSYPTSPKSCLHIHVCISIHAFLHVHVFLAAGLHVHVHA